MQEDLLHFIWKYKKLQLKPLISSDGDSILIESPGVHNNLSGPDFFNAKIDLAGQLWAGNVEIHVKASDWYAHKHQYDAAYDNVILHVVWENDAAVLRKDGTEISTLELKNYVSVSLLHEYQQLFDNSLFSFINCEKSIAEIDQFVFNNWIERLFFERLERKSNFILELLEQSQGDWEQVLFTLLLKNFGLKINSEAFLSLAGALPFAIVRKLQSNALQLESVLFGMGHLLDDDLSDEYQQAMKKEYNYLAHKFQLSNAGVFKPHFFKLRPSNFPTIRLSQLAALYHKNQSLFEKIVSATDVKSLYAIFNCEASTYWSTHYTFAKTSKSRLKKLTKKFIDLIIINSVLPLKFSYHKQQGRAVDDDMLKIISEVTSENNTIISNFRKHKVRIDNAKETQGVLELYNEYCSKNRCLECAIGNSLLQ